LDFGAGLELIWFLFDSATDFLVVVNLPVGDFCFPRPGSSGAVPKVLSLPIFRLVQLFVFPARSVLGRSSKATSLFFFSAVVCLASIQPPAKSFSGRLVLGSPAESRGLRRLRSQIRARLCWFPLLEQV
jgi:hypothetical protein